jgi:hypothetical protein
MALVSVSENVLAALEAYAVALRANDTQFRWYCDRVADKPAYRFTKADRDRGERLPHERDRALEALNAAIRAERK